MGNLINSNSTPTQEYKILLSGLDAAGKTTMLYKIKASDMTQPSMSLWTVDTARYKNFQILSWDSGGQMKNRNLLDLQQLWPIKRQYLTNVAGIIYFVDANDRERLEESVEELEREILNVEENRLTAERVPVLIFANKMDLPHAMSKDEIRAAFDLSTMKRRAWHVQSSCATSGDGLYEGLDWFSKEIERGSHSVTAACTLNGGEA